MFLDKYVTKWHCPECNNILRHKEVLRRKIDHGMWIESFMMCLVCGNMEDIVTVETRMAELILERHEK